MSSRTVPAANLVLRDAPVYDDGAWRGDWLAIGDGRILACGSESDVAGLIGPRTEVQSLRGNYLLPAFHDSHIHPVAGGLEMSQCDLSHATSVDEYLAIVASYAAANPKREWITGAGWSMADFPGGVPSGELLDRVCPDRPVFLPNRDHHSAWVNSKALELAGIDASTPDPSDGRIERDADGHPTGALHEGAMALVGRLIPPPSADELYAALLTAQGYLHSLGIVGWQDALVGQALGMSDTLATYIAAQRAGDLTAKVVLALWWDRDRGLDQIPELLERRQLAARAGLRATSIKIMQDGVCETHTAAMLEPYLNQDGHPSDNTGLEFLDAQALAHCVAALDAEDFQVHIHALGDRAVRDSLDAVEHAIKLNGRRGNRHHLAHIQVIHPDDVPRFAQLDVIANAQPLWACREQAMEELTLPFLSETARRQQYVFGSLRDSGARLAFGSDWPVSSPDPLLGIHVAVNRRFPEMPTSTPPLHAEEALTVVEAIAGYTTGTAYLNGGESSTGRLRPGHAADIVALDIDILQAGPAGIGDSAVTRTFSDGREVFVR